MKEFKYEKIEKIIEQWIHEGHLKIGDRVPSIREMTSETGMSVATVLQAYRNLEDRGLIKPRPQSGYFVQLQTDINPLSHQPQSFSFTPKTIRHLDSIDRILSAASDESFAPLGGAIPSVDLLPTKELSKLYNSLLIKQVRHAYGYEMVPGNRELIQQIAKYDPWLERLHEEEILITNGCTEAIYLALRATTQPGDTVAVESPCFFNFMRVCKDLELNIVEMPTHPETGLILDTLGQVLERRKISACLFMPTLNNPLGCNMPEENRIRLVQMLDEKNIPLIEDDLYRELYFHHDPIRSAKSFDQTGNVILCSSFSKTLDPGCRIGWMAAGRYFDKVIHLKQSLSLASSTMAQIAIAEFLKSGQYDRYIRNLRKNIKNQIKQYSAAIQKYFPKGTALSQPKGGFLLWVELPTPIDALELFERAYTEKISIVPGPLFSANHYYKNCIRISCGHPWNDRIDMAILRLGQLAHELLIKKAIGRKETPQA